MDMNTAGILRCKYIIEDNTELGEKIIKMVQMDNTAQWLAGDDLKQDQLKFIYKIVKIVYDSALKDFLINDDPKVLDIVIPQLVAYHAILNIKNILEAKDALKRKLEEKAEREGKKGVQFLVPEEEKKEEPA